VKGLDGVPLKYADDAHVRAGLSPVHVGRHQQVLGAVQGSDGPRGDPRGASLRRLTRLRGGHVRPGHPHSEAEDEDKGSEEEEEEPPFNFFCLVHPAADDTECQPEARIGNERSEDTFEEQTEISRECRGLQLQMHSQSVRLVSCSSIMVTELLLYNLIKQHNHKSFPSGAYNVCVFITRRHVE